MLRRYHLVGPYAAYHDGPIEMDTATVWDAIEAITLQLPGFRPNPIAGRQRIQVPGYNTIEKLKSASNDNDIYIMPVLSFGKEGGFIQTIVGSALIVVGFVVSSFAPEVGVALMNIGIMMVVGGLTQLLMPVPKIGANEQEERSKYLPLTQNTVAIGTPIPILYGRRRVGGHLLSINIDAGTPVGVPDVTTTPGGGAPSTGGGGGK